MTFRLGRRSIRELQGVRPDLVGVVKLAIKITSQDFSVHDGLREIEEQREYVRRKVSKTMASMHLVQSDGYGHATDLVPYINGKLRWEWLAIYPIASAMRQAAMELGVELVWGGCWRSLTGSSDSPADMAADYVARCNRAGRKIFLDGPHYELRG